MPTGQRLTADNISTDAIKAILASAGIVASDYGDGDLIIQSTYDALGCIVRLRKTKTVFRVTTNCGFKDSVPRTQRLSCANNINGQYPLANAYVENDRIYFCRDIIVTGGITEANLVDTVKSFMKIPVAALKEYAGGLLE